MKVEITVDGEKIIHRGDLEWIGDFCGELISSVVASGGELTIVVKATKDEVEKEEESDGE